MPFYDKASYSSHLRAQNSDHASIIFSLAFTTGESHLAVGTTTGRLSLHALPPATPQSHTIILQNEPSINALLIVDDYMYVGADNGLHVLDCNHPTETRIIAKGCVNALSKCDGSVLAATTDGFSLIRHDGIHPIATVPHTAYPHCVTAVSPTSFLAGCDDGTLRTYDLKYPIPRETTISDLTPRPYITSIAVNADQNFALVADTSNTLTSIHLPTDSVAATTTTPFLPQALAFCDGHFYCGGSDSSVQALLRYDVSCKPQKTIPISIDSVYAFGLASSGALAVAGFCRNRKQLVDVYDNPPVRSYSLHV